MATSLQGLFQTPAQASLGREALGIKLGQLDPLMVPTAVAYGAGSGLGKGLGGMMGLQTDEDRLRVLQQEFSDIDINDPAQLRMMGQRLMSEGFGQEGMTVLDRADDLYESQTSRITALKPSSTARSKEQYLLEACQAGNDRACQMYDAIKGSLQAQSRKRGAEAAETEAEIELGLPGLKGQKITAEINKLDIDALKTKAETGHLESKWELERRETEAKIAKTNAETDLKIEELKSAGKLDDARNLTETKNLTADYDTFVGDWRSRKADLEIVMGIGKDRNAITDMGNIFKFMQILDPTSVVREGEQQLVMDARGILDTLKNVDDKVARGRLLTDTQIEQIQEAVRLIYSSQMSSVYDYQQFMKNKVDSYNSMYGANINLENVIPKSEMLVERPGMSDDAYQNRLQDALGE